MLEIKALTEIMDNNNELKTVKIRLIYKINSYIL